MYLSFVTDTRNREILHVYHTRPGLVNTFSICLLTLSSINIRLNSPSLQETVNGER